MAAKNGEPDEPGGLPQEAARETGADAGAVREAAAGAGAREAAGRELERCRTDLAAGRLALAAVHLTRALASAADDPRVYTALDDFAAAAGSNAAAREYFKGDGANIPARNAAAIISLTAADGEIGKALSLLGSVVAAEPAVPWAGAAWFGPHLAEMVTARVVARAVGTIFDEVGYPERPEVRAALEPWLGLIRGAAARPDAGAEALRSLSGAARRLDAASEAVAWCKRAVELDRRARIQTPHSLVMLGFAQRDAGNPARAAEAWQEALKLDPQNAPLHLDLADLAFAQEEFAAAQRWAERAAALDPDSVRARAAVLSANARVSTAASADGMLRDAGAMAELFQLALANPQVGYLRALVTQTSGALHWLNVVPPPTEAIAASAGHASQPDNHVVRVNDLHLSALEAPSAIHGIRMLHPEVRLEIHSVPEPDLRLACSVKHGPPLWSYQGTDAVPCVPPPSKEAVALLYEVAAGVWGDPLAAYERAAPLGALSEDDLLGLLAHVPPAGDFGRRLESIAGLYWNRIAQAWVCVGILHHRAQEQQQWPDSARRTLLLRLLHGPDDWTVDSAAFALCLAAWMHPDHTEALAGELAERYRFAAEAVGRRFTSLHEPLAAIVLACPGIDPRVREQVESNLVLQRGAKPETARTQGRLRRWMTGRGVRVAADE